MHALYAVNNNKEYTRYMADENETPEESEEGKTEEELLDEWQNMAASEGEEDDGGDDDMAAAMGITDRILDQNEIDSLLGVDGDDDDANRGIKALVNTSVVNYERLPMLDHVFDKFERYLSTSLRHFTADNVDITIESITSVRFGDYLNSIPLPAGMVVVNCTGLDDYILLVYESRLIYAVVDILLGGRKARPARIEGRNYTTIERSMVENLTGVVLNDLGEAFAPVAPVHFTAERMEVNPRFASITREGNAAILVTVRVNLEEREGTMEFCMPYATIEPIREQLLQQFVGEKFGQDNIWENHLAQELYHTEVDMMAELDSMQFSLAEVLKWRLGDTITLDAKQNSPIRMKCDDILKMVGHMGKLDDHKAVKVKRTIADINNEREDS